jgi:hypothetical protein
VSDPFRPAIYFLVNDDVARTSAAAFAISFSFAMLISFLSGAAWDMAGKVYAALIPIFLGTLPISILAPAPKFCTISAPFWTAFIR